MGFGRKRCFCVLFFLVCLKFVFAGFWFGLFVDVCVPGQREKTLCSYRCLVRGAGF